MTSTPDVSQQVRRILADELGINISYVTDSGGLRSIKGWTSLTHVRIITGLEKYFQITFSNSELVEMTTVQKITHAVEKKLGQK